MNILFRADASSTIGIGHIMRDLVLANEFKDDEVTFATQNLEGHINHKVMEAGYSLKILDSHDISLLISLIKKLDIEMLVIDHYGIDYHDEKRLKVETDVKLFVLDDTYEKHHCDVLLNHNVSAGAHRYEGLVPQGCELRCGAKYTLLRDEFIMIEKRDRSIVSQPMKVLLAMGGADNANLNIEILKVLEAFPLSIMIVTTTANSHLEELKTYVKDSKHIALHINSHEVAKLMNESDFAIITPSVTVNEAIYMKLPFIAIQTADNQREIYHYLLKNSYFVLEKFDEKQLKRYVTLSIHSLLSEVVNFVDLSMSEKEMVLVWRNHPSVSKWMFTQKKISLKEHLAYIDGLWHKKDRCYFLVRYKGKEIGVIDFTNIDKEKCSADIGLYSGVDIYGVGDMLMEAIMIEGFYTLGCQRLIAEVKKENHKAIALYERYGFKQIKEQENVLTMEVYHDDW